MPDVWGKPVCRLWSGLGKTFGLYTLRLVGFGQYVEKPRSLQLVLITFYTVIMCNLSLLVGHLYQLFTGPITISY